MKRMVAMTSRINSEELGMERALAEKLAEQFLALDEPLKVAAELAEKIEDPNKKSRTEGDRGGGRNRLH